MEASPRAAQLLCAHLDSLDRAIPPWRSKLCRGNHTGEASVGTRLGQHRRVDLQYLATYSTSTIAHEVEAQFDCCRKGRVQSAQGGDWKDISVFDQRRRAELLEHKALAITAAMSGVCLALGMSERWTLNKISRRRHTQALLPGLELDLYGASTVCGIAFADENRLVCISNLGFEVVVSPHRANPLQGEQYLATALRQLETAKRHCDRFSLELESDQAGSNNSTLFESDRLRYNLLRKVTRQYQAQIDQYAKLWQ